METITPSRSPIRIGRLQIDPNRLVVGMNGSEIKVSPRDMDVLLILANAKGKVVSREAILDQVWDDVIVNDEAVSLSISRLRSALGESAKHPSIIQTIPKRGYRLLCETPPKTRKRSYDRIALAVVVGLFVIMTLLFLQVHSNYHDVADQDLVVLESDS